MALSFKDDALKAKQQATWQAGDYHKIGSLVVGEAERLVERMDLAAGAKVLDVAAGTGNAALAAARRNAVVTATDFVPALLDHAYLRAKAEGLELSTVAADCESLPFEDGSFDAAVSSFGIMFAPNHEQAAREIARVVRKGGKVGLANWTPTGFIGQLLKTVGQFMPPPPPGMQSPVLWGAEDHLRKLFPGAELDIAERDFVFRFASTEDWIDHFRAYYGPTNRAFAIQSAAEAEALHGKIKALLDSANTAEKTLRVPSSYLEVVITVEPPHLNWSTAMFRKRRTENGEQATQARGNNSEAAAG
jgi:SAM-dependent methyltransferase